MLIYSRRKATLVALTIGLLFSSSSYAGGPIVIPEEVRYSEDSIVRQAIKDECELGEKMSSYLAKYIGSTKTSSVPTDQGKYLDLSITGVHAVGGAVWSGSKWMEVKGTLVENGKPVSSFDAKRTTRGGGWGACGAAQKCAKAISKDISIWLESPVNGAKLGEANQ